MVTTLGNSANFLERRCARWALNRFSKIRVGRLEVELPGGRVESFGTPTGKPQADIQVRDFRFFVRVVLGGDVGFGESFVAREWESGDVVELVKLFLENRDVISDGRFTFASLLRVGDLVRHRLRRNTLSQAPVNVRRHYDLGNDLFESFLDESMVYSCAIYSNPSHDLEVAQRAKIDLIIEKAGIGAEDHVLDIGCGWGGFAVAAARQTGCTVTAITLSDEQFRYAKDRVRAQGLSDRVEVLKEDFRAVRGRYDKIVSIEMLEAVGHEYYDVFFACCERLLSPQGRIVLQTITIPDESYSRKRWECDWIQKHVFPGGSLPSVRVLHDSMTRSSRLSLEHSEEIGKHYVHTLRAWRDRFVGSRWGRDARVNKPTSYRTWLYYLATCEAGFSCGVLRNFQLVLAAGPDSGAAKTAAGVGE